MKLKSANITLLGFLFPFLTLSAQDDYRDDGVYYHNLSETNAENDSTVSDVDNEYRTVRTIPLEEQPERIYAPDTTSALSAPVGSPEGIFSVSPLGAATYSIKIDVPDGRNGMQPDVSLVYNSQGGNDVAGFGFGLSCMSSIRFVGKDIYHDGVAKGINFSYNDDYPLVLDDNPLALDGRRMILKTGTAGVTGAVYTLEGDPFTTINLLFDYNTGKPYFEVRTKDGMKYEYGKTSAVQTMNINHNEHIVAWYLRACYDSHNNSMTYSYTNSENFMYLNQIQYGGRSVNFKYNYRTTDPQTYYIGDVQCVMRKRLQAITSKEGNNIFRTDTLRYDSIGDQSGTQFSRLVSVTRYNGSGESLRPITINWNHLTGFGMSQGLKNLEKVTIQGNPTIYRRSFFATDMNGDGISDLVHLYLTNYINNQNVNAKRTHVFIRPSEIDSDGNVSFDTPIEFTAPPTYVTYCGDYCHNNLANCDIDGDGKNDICLVTVTTEDNSHNVSYYIITSDSLQSGGTELTPADTVHVSYNDKEPIYTICDFDNDGKSEIIQIEYDSVEESYRCYYFFNTDTALLQHSYTNLNFTSEPKRIFNGDFNNDGMADILLFFSDSCIVLYNNGMMHGVPPFSLSNSDTITNLDNKTYIFQGDFNGDGLPDFIMNNKQSPNYYVAYCNGDGTFTKSSAIRLGLYDESIAIDDERFTIMVTDLDHDNKSDLLLGKANYSNLSVFRWLRSTGTGFELMRVSQTNNMEDARPNYIFSGDFTGNGQAEIMNYGNNIYYTLSRSDGLTGEDGMAGDNDFVLTNNQEDSTSGQDMVEEAETDDDPSGTRSSQYDVFRLYTHTGMNASSGRVRKITDGFDNVTSLRYSSLVNGGIYERCDTCAYPLNDICAPLSVLSGYTTTNGAAGNESVSFSYGGLRAHVAGKGLLGFTYTTSTDSVSGKTVRQEVLELDPVHYESLSKSTITSIGGVSSNVTDMFRINDGGGTQLYGDNYWIHLHETEKIDIFGNRDLESISASEIDGYTTCVFKRSDMVMDLYNVVAYDSYVLKGGAYRPTAWHTVSAHPDSQYEESEIHYTASYNNKGDRTSYTENSGNSLARTTTCTYDTYGNLTSKTIQTTADSTMTFTYTYSGGRYLASSSTNPSTGVHTYTYDTWGNPLTHTLTICDTIHNTTVNTYDGWGNLTRSVSPEGYITTYKRGWGSTPTKRYYILERRQGMPWKKTWYDSRGREVLVESVGPDHVHHDRETVYDSMGLVVMKRETLGLRQTCDTLSYDALGRLIEERHTGGGNTTYSYDSLKVTGVRNGITTVQQTDPWGNVKSVNENGILITYTYGPNHKPIQITSAGHTVSLTYDNMGRRLSLADPDAGTSTWQYDRAGNVTRFTDPRGTVTTNNYFATGKLRKSVVDGVNHWYKYDPTWTMLEEEWKSGFNNRVWHDRYGQVYYTGKWKSGENGTANRYHYYDAYGRERETTRSHGPTTTYTYDDNGFRIQTKVGDKVVWRLGCFTGLKEECYVIDDSLTIMNEYDNAGRPVALVRTLTTDAGPVIQRRSVEDNDGENAEEFDGTVDNEPTRYVINPIYAIDAYEYTYNLSTGNLQSSSYSNLGLLPSVRRYEYDALDRLVKSKKTWRHGIHQYSDSIMVSFGNDGNILSKTGIGSYTYGSTRPHAVTGVENTNSLISSAEQSITYNSYLKASYIEDGDYAMTIDYGPERQRWKSVLTYDDGNGTETVRSVRYHDDKDIIEEDGKYYSITYLDGGVICLKNLQTNAMSFYLTCTDMLGSVTKIVKSDRSEVFKAEYDEWGRQTVTTNTIGFIRGYTGHEMLPEFGLVNMNGRMYDPLLGRFLSPDDYVQMPMSPQGFNRYTYCLNNPVKYVDPSGELFGLATLVGFFKGIGKLFKGEKWYTPFTEAFKNFKLETKLLGGMFQGNFKQVFSRLTWESIQTSFGLLFSQINLTIHDVENVDFFHGATYIINRNKHYRNGLTLGSYINIQTKTDAPKDKSGNFDPTLDPLYMHEYGHYLQSQRIGFGYVPFIGIPSLFSCLLLNKIPGFNHHNFYTEVIANRLANPFFKSISPNLDWDIDVYPLKYSGLFNKDKIINLFPFSNHFGYY